MKKKIFITGCGSGLGLNLAKKLKNKHYDVIINVRNKKDKNKLLKYFVKKNIIVADLNNAKDLINASKYIKKFFRTIDVMVCNAGGNIINNSNSLSAWNKIIDKNFWTTVNSVLYFEKLIKKNGKIICISSICGKEYIEGAPTNYSVAKSAVNAFVKFYSHHTSFSNKTINAIIPGNLMFKGSVWDKKMKLNKKNVRNYIKKNVPSNQFGNIEAILDMINYIINQKNNFLNGSLLTLDGGQTKSL
jgi:NAD(P)-dependent dehydrogenase (short-subunit alcohol dehydrogenase family)